MKKAIIGLCAAAGVLASASAAFAVETTSSNTQMNIQATVKKGCAVSFKDNQTTYDFGTVAALVNPKFLHGEFSMQCTNGFKSAKVELDGGQNSKSDTKVRKLALLGTDQTLDYQVYQGNVDADSGQIWGMTDTNAYKIAVGAAAGAGQGGAVESAYYPFTVVLKAQDIATKADGVYRDVLTATVTYNKL